MDNDITYIELNDAEINCINAILSGDKTYDLSPILAWLNNNIECAGLILDQSSVGLAIDHHQVQLSGTAYSMKVKA